MSDQNDDNVVVEDKKDLNVDSEDLKILPKEELESKVDILLAKCRAEVDIKNTAEQGAMFRKGPFQISISLAVKMKQYQDDLLYCRRNPYDVLLRVCADNDWGTPEFRAVDYMPGEGFLFSIVVKDHELVSKWRNRRPLLAADLASANFLRYLGLWVNVKNLGLFFEWEPTSDDFGGQNKEENLNGYLYFMGFNVVKTEETYDEETTSASSVFSLRLNIQLQLTKLMYIFLVSRGEQTCWLTDIDVAFFKRIFGELEPDATHALNTESWRSRVLCSCKEKRHKICFRHDEYFFYLLLKDFYYVKNYGPIDVTVFEKLKVIKKEEDKGKYGPLKDSSPDEKPDPERISLAKIKDDKKGEADDSKHSTQTKKKEVNSHKKVLKSEDHHSKKNLTVPTSPTKIDPTETPINLRVKKFDLRSKIFGKPEVEKKVKEEKVDFKLSFDNLTGLSNVKSSVGNIISLVDVSPPRMPQATSSKRPSTITTVVTIERKKKRIK